MSSLIGRFKGTRIRWLHAPSNAPLTPVDHYSQKAGHGQKRRGPTSEPSASNSQSGPKTWRLCSSLATPQLCAVPGQARISPAAPANLPGLLIIKIAELAAGPRQSHEDGVGSVYYDFDRALTWQCQDLTSMTQCVIISYDAVRHEVACRRLALNFRRCHNGKGRGYS